MKKYNTKQLEKFDNLLTDKTHVEKEKILKQLLPLAKSLKNKSIYLEMLARLALNQTILRKFKLAHGTLDKAEKELTTEHTSIKIRLLIERGRCLYLSNNSNAALPIFKKAYHLSKKYHYEDLMIDAIHFMPVMVKNINEKIKWNLKAIAIAKKSSDKQMANDWLATLYQAIGLNYIDAKQYKNSLLSFQNSKKISLKLNQQILVLGANIGIAKSLRLLNRTDKAFDMLVNLLKTWEYLAEEQRHPTELQIFHGWICEDLAEIYLAKSKKFAALSYDDLSKDEWHIKFASKRLSRLKKLM